MAGPNRCHDANLKFCVWLLGLKRNRMALGKAVDMATHIEGHPAPVLCTAGPGQAAGRTKHLPASSS